jgi:hypothetical protein
MDSNDCVNRYFSFTPWREFFFHPPLEFSEFQICSKVILLVQCGWVSLIRLVSGDTSTSSVHRPRRVIFTEHLPRRKLLIPSS